MIKIVDNWRKLLLPITFSRSLVIVKADSAMSASWEMVKHV